MCEFPPVLPSSARLGGGWFDGEEYQPPSLGYYIQTPTPFRRAVYSSRTGHVFNKGDVLRHHCFQLTGRDSRGLCINPEHLTVGTPGENCMDAAEDDAIRYLLDIKNGVFPSEDHWVDHYTHPKSVQEAVYLKERRKLANLSYEEKRAVKVLKTMDKPQPKKQVCNTEDWKTIVLS